MSYQEGNIKLNVYNVTEEDGNIKMHYKDTNKIELTVDLNDYPENDKILKIQLSEGLKYSSLQVLEVTDSSYQTEIAKTNTLYNAIKGVNTDNIKVEDNTLYTSDKTFPNSVYGEVLYEIKKEVRQLSISFNITSDLFRYYGEHIVRNGIVVEVLGENQIIGRLEKNFKLFDKETEEFKFISRSAPGYEYNKSVMASTFDPLNIKYGNYIYVANTFKFNNVNITGLPKYKNVVYELYYPEGTTFETLIDVRQNELTNISKYENIPLSNLLNDQGEFKLNELNGRVVCINYPSENKVIVVYTDNLNDTVHLSIKYKVNDIVNFVENASIILMNFYFFVNWSVFLIYFLLKNNKDYVIKGKNLVIDTMFTEYLIITGEIFSIEIGKSNE